VPHKSEVEPAVSATSDAVHTSPGVFAVPAAEPALSNCIEFVVAVKVVMEETFLVKDIAIPFMVEPAGMVNPKLVPIKGLSTSSFPCATSTVA
jgi:hypothetical protein